MALRLLVVQTFLHLDQGLHQMGMDELVRLDR
jgi:hypothetical protein